jgi:hypothetical protein
VSSTSALSWSVVAFLLGIAVGLLVARRGKALRIDWRLRIDSTEGRLERPERDDGPPEQ